MCEAAALCREAEEGLHRQLPAGLRGALSSPGRGAPHGGHRAPRRAGPRAAGGNASQPGAARCCTGRSPHVTGGPGLPRLRASPAEQLRPPSGTTPGRAGRRQPGGGAGAGGRAGRGPGGAGRPRAGGGGSGTPRAGAAAAPGAGREKVGTRRSGRGEPGAPRPPLPGLAAAPPASPHPAAAPGLRLRRAPARPGPRPTGASCPSHRAPLAAGTGAAGARAALGRAGRRRLPRAGVLRARVGALPSCQPRQGSVWPSSPACPAGCSLYPVPLHTLCPGSTSGTWAAWSSCAIPGEPPVCSPHCALWLWSLKLCLFGQCQPGCHHQAGRQAADGGWCCLDSLLQESTWPFRNYVAVPRWFGTGSWSFCTREGGTSGCTQRAEAQGCSTVTFPGAPPRPFTRFKAAQKEKLKRIPCLFSLLQTQIPLAILAAWPHCLDTGGVSSSSPAR